MAYGVLQGFNPTLSGLLAKASVPMNLRNLITSGAIVVALAGSASAASYNWVWTTTTVPVDYLAEGGDTSHGENFDISLVTSYNPVAYNASLHNISSATVYFAFADDKNGPDVTTSSSSYDIAEYVDISVGGTKLWNNAQVDGTHSGPPDSYHWLSMALPTALLDDLKADGMISFLVQIQNLNDWWSSGSSEWKREDTYLKVAKIHATGVDIPPPPPPPVGVPDGGSSIALLGLGTLCLAALRKKFRR